MNVVVSNELVQATRMSQQELKQELAVVLFQKDKLTLGQAAQLAEMSPLRFQYLLTSRAIPVHYDIEDFEQDLVALRQLGRIEQSITHFTQEL